MAEKPRSSTGKTGCAATAAMLLIGLIGMGQAAGGIGCFVWAVRAIYDDRNWVDGSVATVAAALFGSIGFGLLTAVWVARPGPRTASATAAATDEPWLERPDWASGQILATGGANVAAPVFASVALWWNFASLPFLWALPTFVRQVELGLEWLVLLVPLAGIALVAAFLYQFFRAWKFGQSTFEMARVPGLVGGQLAGVVRINGRVRPPNGFRVRLVCVEWLTRQSERRRSRVDHVIWQDERLVTDPLVESNATAVPVLFEIPFKLPETSRPDSERDFAWRLEVWADMPGINYRALFEVPVYKTAESRPDFRLDESLVSTYLPRPSSDVVLRDTGIIREPLANDGVRLTFKAARNWKSALAISLIALAFLVMAILFLIYNDEARDFFNLKAKWIKALRNANLLKIAGAVFQTFIAVGCGTIYVVITLVLVLTSIDLWLYRSVVEASSTGLTIRAGWLGIGRTRFFPAEDIKRFKLEEYMRSSGGGLWNSVVLVPRRGAGPQRTIGKGIASKLAQEAVIEELNSALGRGNAAAR